MRWLRVTAVALAVLPLAAVTFMAAIWTLSPDPSFLAREEPKSTALIEQRKVEAESAHKRLRIARTWVPLEKISPLLVEAVLASEDAAFYQHGAIDWRETKSSVEKDVEKRSFARGGSTITQQLAKNLYLGTKKTLTRKLVEAVVAWKLEHALSKKRILTLYLNLVEWGDAVFGAEAAARRHFGRSASEIGAAQAVLLAAALPAPRKVDPARPSAWLLGRAQHLVDVLESTAKLDADAAAATRADLDRVAHGESLEEPVDEE